MLHRLYHFLARRARRTWPWLPRFWARQMQIVPWPVLSSPDGVVRRQDPASAYSLTEPGMPKRHAIDGPSIAPLHAFAAWADVERAQNLRWYPSQGKTFCNIYAHDFCHAAGARLPRIWWTSDALRQIAAGKEPLPAYGVNVYEMDANGLYEWLLHWGPSFGWKKARSIDRLQQLANRGSVALISAANHDWHAPGHIAAVLPETANHRAVRRGRRITLPLISEAGARPSACSAASRPWWLESPFGRYGFFYNSDPSFWS